MPSTLPCGLDLFFYCSAVRRAALGAEECPATLLQRAAPRPHRRQRARRKQCRSKASDAGCEQRASRTTSLPPFQPQKEGSFILLYQRATCGWRPWRRGQEERGGWEKVGAGEASRALSPCICNNTIITTPALSFSDQSRWRPLCGAVALPNATARRVCHVASLSSPRFSRCCCWCRKKGTPHSSSRHRWA